MNQRRSIPRHPCRLVTFLCDLQVKFGGATLPRRMATIGDFPKLVREWHKTKNRELRRRMGCPASIGRGGGIARKAATMFGGSRGQPPGRRQGSIGSSAPPGLFGRVSGSAGGDCLGPTVFASEGLRFAGTRLDGGTGGVWPAA